MKKLLLIALLLPFISFGASITYYFSSSSASATENGNIANPFKRISQLDSLVQGKISGVTVHPNDYILFKRGDVFQAHGTVNFTVSGTVGNLIHLGAYGVGPMPVFDAWLNINTSSWSTVKTNVYQTSPVTPNTSIRMLYLDGVFQEYGRWPNKDNSDTAGMLEYDAFKSKDTIIDNNYGTIANRPTDNWAGANIYFRPYHFRVSAATVTRSTLNGTKMTFEFPAQDGNVPSGSYFLSNSIDCLDKQGEWCYNSSTDKVSIYLTSAPSTHDIRISEVSDAINLNAESYIEVADIDFEGYGGYVIQGTGQFTDVRRNRMKDVGSYAIRFKAGNHIIDGNDIEDCMNMGVTINGGNTYFTNNYIRGVMTHPAMHNNGQVGTAVEIYGNNIVIDTNYITNVGTTSILINQGSNWYVRANVLDSGMRWIDDVGILYTVNQRYEYNYTNRRFNNNFILNSFGKTSWLALPRKWHNYSGVLQNSLYLDQFSNHIMMKDNVITSARNAAFFNDASNDSVVNNIFWNYSVGNSGGFGLDLALSREPGVSYTVSSSTGGPNVGKTFTIPVLHDNYVTGNVYYNDTSTTNPANAMYFEKGTNSISSNMPENYGYVNNQYFVYPYAQSNDSYFRGSNIGDESWKTWNTKLHYDSVKTFYRATLPSGATRANVGKLVMNYTKHDSIISLGNKTYIDSKTQQQYNGNYITLKPFTAAALVLTGNYTGTDTVANKPPTISLDNPNNNDQFTVGSTGSTTVNFAATAADGDGTLTKVEFYVNNVLKSTQTTSVNGVFSYGYVATPGTYAIKATAYDNLGLKTTTSVSTIIVNKLVVTPPPVIDPTLDIQKLKIKIKRVQER